MLLCIRDKAKRKSDSSAQGALEKLARGPSRGPLTEDLGTTFGVPSCQQGAKDHEPAAGKLLKYVAVARVIEAQDKNTRTGEQKQR